VLFAGTMLPVAAVRAEPPQDTASIWTIQDENASISTASLTDRYYVNGLKLGWISPTTAVPDAIASLGHVLWGDGVQRVGINLTQYIYTPADTEAVIPPPGDRPYAGVLMANFSLLSDTDTSRSTVMAGIGVVGPWALAEQVQNGIHDLIGQKRNNGWGTQLKNEPALQLMSDRVWRLNTGTVGGLETQALPALQAGLGNVRIYAMAGLTMRIGQGLDEDYGVPRIPPGMSGGDAFIRTRNFAWYVFAGADGQAVAHDITLNGNMWHDSPSVSLVPFVGEFQGGLALLYHGVRVTFSEVAQTAEFRHQKGGLHQFGSLSLSVRF
jgi:hypothetical protein